MKGSDIATALKAARTQLSVAGIATSALDARLLLQHVMAMDHAQLLSIGNHPLTEDQANRFAAAVARRLAHEPVSKIIGWNEFYGRRFLVNAHVLDPRPDTETLIDLALASQPSPAPRLLDLGTGSGAILLTLLCEWPQATGIAVDISPDALHVAAQNAASLGVSQRCEFHRSSWFEYLSETFDLILSNPPYITSADVMGLAPDVKDHDPLLALDGGQDGLDAYHAIAAGAVRHLAKNGSIILEVGAGQRNDVEAIFAAQGYRLSDIRRDLGGHERALRFTL
jgi:release factor glutamine methyltransferase